MHVGLQNKQAFKDALANYQPSQESVSILAQMPLVILQGISASGRNTIIDYLVSHNDFHQIISDTTRPPKLRNGVMEQDGAQYFFRPEDELLEDLKNGKFLEAELIHDQQVSGISVRELEKAFKTGKTPINEVARQGVGSIRRAKADTLFFFVVPPSYDLWVQRLQLREVMSDEEFGNRKRSAILEIEDALSAPDFIFVVNDSVERVGRIIAEAVSGKIDKAEDITARQIATSILARLTD